MTGALARAVAAADPFGDGDRASAAGDGGASAGALREAAAEAFSDVFAASLAVAQDPSALADRDRLLAWARDQGTPAVPRPVIGAGDPTDPATPGLTAAHAALVGGFQAHLLDLDDTHEDVRGHPSAVLVPTLLALAADDRQLDELYAAYVVGLEVMARLGRTLGPAHYAAGWHPTGTAGAVAAAAAGAHLLRLDAEQTATALSIAASRSGGVRAQFGTPGKPLHAGLAAQAGVEAVEWARTGLHTADAAVTGPSGLLAAFGVGEEERAALTAGFGETWAILSPGIWQKRFPFCSAAMSMADAAAQLAPAIDPSAIREVVVRVRQGADAALVHTAPTTGEEARFSAEAILALILLGRTPDLAELSPRPLNPQVTALAAKVRREHVPGEPLPGGRRDFWAEVEVDAARGAVHRASVQRPHGAPGTPLSADARRAKLAAATGDVSRAERIRALLGVTDAPPQTPVGRLLAELTATPTPTSTPLEGPTA
ncbi:MmgE/PrpD family protein [Brachybacterium sp. J153]|uniref:MmgE/PrpD family protein n=1 Tax=Brachybacterium sp. J153 TaxID=3116488 RepID=UPI002E7621BE|nr:MmgE/PrpD family protein [Brachybacterium sp. J153]MEE1617818.1 MmgE/PrpD family protein [Brachybacterium sp. J153]